MKIRNVVRLGYRHKAFLIYCLVVVICFRVALLFSTYRKISRNIRKRPAPVPAPRSPYLVSWAVRNCARIVPRAHCLTQALATQYIMAREGLTAVIRIGVSGSVTGNVRAHAWVLYDDVVILGGSDHTLADYKVLTNLEPQGS